MKESREFNWDNPSFIPVIPQPTRIIPKRSPWRRKGPRRREYLPSPKPVRGFDMGGSIEFKKAA